MTCARARRQSSGRASSAPRCRRTAPASRTRVATRAPRSRGTSPCSISPRWKTTGWPRPRTSTTRPSGSTTTPSCTASPPTPPRPVRPPTRRRVCPPWVGPACRPTPGAWPPTAVDDPKASGRRLIDGGDLAALTSVCRLPATPRRRRREAADPDDDHQRSRHDDDHEAPAVVHESEEPVGEPRGMRLARHLEHRCRPHPVSRRRAHAERRHDDTGDPDHGRRHSDLVSGHHRVARHPDRAPFTISERRGHRVESHALPVCGTRAPRSR